MQRNETLIAIGDIGKYVKHKESEEEPFKEEFLVRNAYFDHIIWNVFTNSLCSGT